MNRRTRFRGRTFSVQVQRKVTEQSQSRIQAHNIRTVKSNNLIDQHNPESEYVRIRVNSQTEIAYTRNGTQTSRPNSLLSRSNPTPRARFLMRQRYFRLLTIQTQNNFLRRQREDWLDRYQDLYGIAQRPSTVFGFADYGDLFKDSFDESYYSSVLRYGLEIISGTLSEPQRLGLFYSELTNRP